MTCKNFLIILILSVLPFGMQAQSLYKTVYERANKVVNDPKSPQEQIEINQFEVTVLNYIMHQVRQRGLEKDNYFYDSQAVNMKSFVDDFLFYVTKARAISPAKRVEVINCYREASLAHPLFGDLNKERTLCYVNDSKTYTPFSIDTDWEKAYDQASARIKTIMR